MGAAGLGHICKALKDSHWEITGHSGTKTQSRRVASEGRALQLQSLQLGDNNLKEEGAKALADFFNGGGK
jgi:hypothetical protein